jgi:uncharacterized protein YgiB involved in biofilm formation
MRRKKKNKAKQKRDIARKRKHTISLCPFATFFNTCVLQHIDEHSISSVGQQKKNKQNNKHKCNQSPHNLKRERVKKEIIIMKWRKNEERETIL